ncbi:RICIN domain-containing protein [Saccharothrix luteola]|uniref:RICIN domain-containing protein n=1 Tax=Saccharothrix luteola TaxID=2893018 RepID=UPI001E4C8BA1|nr:RICIN domain-containing protein [Saccharothrix luteola]MCC8249291.1 RICIN domain-containing protein [Saccharothrix luteola]
MITRRFSMVAVAVLTAVGSALFPVAPATASISASTVTTIVNRAAGMCLDVPGGSLDNKKPVQTYHCNGGANQQWEYLPSTTPGYGQFRNVASQKCLDVRGASTDPGATIQQYICMDVPNQKWSYVASLGYLRALHSGGCAAAEHLQYKAPVTQHPCNPSYFVFTLWNVSI